MAVKHVIEYFNQIADQRKEMLNNLKDFEEECAKGLVEPERLEKIKENIQPILDNYQTLSYIMFLLNKPVKKSKQYKYTSQNKKLLNSIDKKFTQTGIIEENNQALEQLKKTIKGG